MTLAVVSDGDDPVRRLAIQIGYNPHRLNGAAAGDDGETATAFCEVLAEQCCDAMEHSSTTGATSTSTPSSAVGAASAGDDGTTTATRDQNQNQNQHSRAGRIDRDNSASSIRRRKRNETLSSMMRLETVNTIFVLLSLPLYAGSLAPSPFLDLFLCAPMDRSARLIRGLLSIVTTRTEAMRMREMQAIANATARPANILWRLGAYVSDAMMSIMTFPYFLYTVLIGGAPMIVARELEFVCCCCLLFFCMLLHSFFFFKYVCIGCILF
jgi:hypothetical protein